MRQKFYAKSVSVAKETDRIKELAEKVGIILPSTHTALFQSVYAPINEANLNGVRLAEGAVNDALTRMVGSQANLEHMGYGWIIGIILDTWINDSNEIEIIYSFAKNIYKDEYTLALEAMANNELSVSFELLAETSQQEKLSDGTILLHEIDFQGVGVLIDNPPAYPKAKTYEFAKAIKERVNKSKNKELVFASQVEQTCDAILKEENENPTLPDSSIELDKNKDILANQKGNEDKSKEGGNVIVTEEQKAKIEELRVELGDFAKEISDEDLLDEAIVAKIREEKSTKEAEINAEAKEETPIETTEEVAVEKTEETPVEATEEAPVEKTEEVAYKVDSVEIRTFSLVEKDGVEVVEESVDIITVRDYNSMKEAIAKVTELEESLKTKDSEIENIKVNAEKLANVKIQLKDNSFAKDFTDEDFLSEEKVEKAIQDAKNAELLASLKEELKENEYAKDFTDEDYLNETKVELAKVKKEKDELKAKVPVEKIEATVKTDEEMETGNSDESKDDYQEVMASIRKENKDKRESQKVYKRK